MRGLDQGQLLERTQPDSNKLTDSDMHITQRMFTWLAAAVEPATSALAVSAMTTPSVVENVSRICGARPKASTKRGERFSTEMITVHPRIANRSSHILKVHPGTGHGALWHTCFISCGRPPKLRHTALTTVSPVWIEYIHKCLQLFAKPEALPHARATGQRRISINNEVSTQGST